MNSRHPVTTYKLLLFDSISTYIMVRIGMAEEANPTINLLIDKLGLAGGLTARTIIVCTLAYWLKKLHKHLVFPLNVLLAGVCGYHLTIIVFST